MQLLIIAEAMDRRVVQAGLDAGGFEGRYDMGTIGGMR
jgi:hypothetical protein